MDRSATSVGSIRALAISNAITGPAVRYVYICHTLMPATMDEFQSNSSLLRIPQYHHRLPPVCDPMSFPLVRCSWTPSSLAGHLSKSMSRIKSPHRRQCDLSSAKTLFGSWHVRLALKRKHHRPPFLLALRLEWFLGLSWSGNWCSLPWILGKSRWVQIRRRMLILSSA